MTKKELRKYIKGVKANLYCLPRLKRKHIRELKADLYDYLMENPKASIKNIENDFGSTIYVAESIMMDNYSEKTRAKFKKSEHIRRYFLIFFLVFLFFCILLGCVLILKDQTITIVHDGPFVGT